VAEGELVRAMLRGEPEESQPAAHVEETGARDLDEWPDAKEPVPVFEQEDAGQTVPR